MVKRNVKQGGLLRCCLNTLDSYHGYEAEGTTKLCNFCPTRMMVKDGAWVWDKEYEQGYKA